MCDYCHNQIHCQMKKTLRFLWIFLFVLNLTSFSQDVIYKKDGSREEVKVLEINSKEISYKKFSNPNGPTYFLEREKVSLIAYENGEHELIDSETVLEPEKEPEIAQEYKANIFALHLFDVIFGDIAVSYERILNTGMLGLKIPVGIGFYGEENQNGFPDFNNVFYSGFGLNFYPGRQGKARYFVGPHIRLGKGKHWSSYSGTRDYVDFFYLKYLVDNGLTLTPVENLAIEFILTTGIRYIPESDGQLEKVLPTMQFAINLALKF